MLGEVFKENELRLTGEVCAIRRVVNDDEAECKKHLWVLLSGGRRNVVQHGLSMWQGTGDLEPQKHRHFTWWLLIF